MKPILPTHRSLLLALPLLVVTISGCKREFDTPPVRTLQPGNVVTIAQLKAMYQGAPVHFSDHVDSINTVFAVVTADEQNGNLYKNVYVQDQTGAIAVRLLYSGGLYQGDSIRIYLPGTVLSPYNGLMQIDSVDVDNNIVKQATGVHVAPTPTTINEIFTQSGLGGSLQSKLITLSNVEFIAGDTGQTYADPVNQVAENRNLKNCSGDSMLVVRTSGYANFAGQLIPTGNGTFTGIVSWFGSSAQLYIRDINEVQLNGPRCGLASCDPAPSINENFDGVVNNAVVDIPCWFNLFTEGTGKWKGKIIGGESFAEVAPPSFDLSTTSWLISAPLHYSSGMHLNFLSSLGSAWQHDGLQVMVSTDINLTTAAAVLAAPWQTITAATLAGSTTPAGSLTMVGEWIPSGNLDLSSYLSEGDNFVLAFKYTGVPVSQATRYRIDNVSVQ